MLQRTLGMLVAALLTAGLATAATAADDIKQGG